MTAQALPEAVIDAAIAWSIKLDYNDATARTRQAFQHWLEADPLHALAWQRMGALRGGFGGMPAGLALDALNAADAKRRARGRRGAIKLLSFGGMALVAGLAAHRHAPWQRLLADVSTGVGEQRTLRLADGTELALNTDSAVSTELSADRRVIVLRRGEILVTTGADAARRPFWVHTPFGTMQALGTRFVVRLEADRARVTVQEGAVALHPSGMTGVAEVVQAGGSRWMSMDATGAVDNLGVDAGAWADGVIAGKHIRLADLLAELSRYRLGRIDCDARVANLRVSGIFHVKDTDQALTFLTQIQPVSVSYRTRYWVSVGPA